MCAAALVAVDASLAEVDRTPTTLTDIWPWRDGSTLGTGSDIRPVATFVKVSGFIGPRRLVETETDAPIMDRPVTAVQG